MSLLVDCSCTTGGYTLMYIWAAVTELNWFINNNKMYMPLKGDKGRGTGSNWR